MKVENICDILATIAPISFAESWDNTGLLIGKKDHPVSRILLTLDVTSEALLLANRLGSEMIIAVHPLIFNPLYNLQDEPPINHLINNCIKNDLAVYAVHTSLDACLGGINDSLAMALNLQVVDTLCPLDEANCHLQHQLLENPDLQAYLKYMNFNDFSIKPGYGRIAVANEKVHAKPFVRQLNDRLQTTGSIINFDKDKRYQRILLWGGAFDGSLIKQCVDQNIDCVVAGEIKHNQLIALNELNIHAIACGHDVSERTILNPLKVYLDKMIPECRIAVNSGLSYNNLIY